MRQIQLFGFLLSFGNLLSQIPMQQSLQIPIYSMPAFAGSTEKHRICAAILGGTNTDQFSGSQYIISYDQKFRSLAIGVFGSAGTQQLGTLSSQEKLLLNTVTKKEFIRSTSFKSVGVVLAPKFNFTQHTKPKYTISPAVGIEIKRNNVVAVDQFRITNYTLISGNNIATGNSIFEFVEHRAEIKETRFMVNLLFNGPSFYISAGAEALQRVTRDNGAFYSLGENNYLSQSFLSEASNTYLSATAGGGVSFPLKASRPYSFTVSGLSALSFPVHYFPEVENSFRNIEEVSSSKISVNHSTMSALLRFKKLVVGSGLYQYLHDYNPGICLGIQTSTYRVLGSYNMFRKSSYAGSAEITMQYRF